MGDAAGWLQWGAIGIAGLALVQGGRLLQSPPSVAGGAEAEQWNSNLRRFLAFAIALVVIAAGIEILEQVLPNHSEQAKITQLERDLDTANEKLPALQAQYDAQKQKSDAAYETQKRKAEAAYDAQKQRADTAESLLKAATNHNLFATEIAGYAKSLNQLSGMKRCFDSSLIPDSSARLVVIQMVDAMDAVIGDIAKATGQQLSAAPACRQKS